MSPRTAIAAATAGVAVVVAAAVALGGPGEPGPRSAADGKVPAVPAGVVVVPEADRRPLPPFAAPTVDGGHLDLAGFRGKVLVLNFWAEWCGPCRAEQAALEQASRDLRDEGVRFVGVNVRDDRFAAAAYLRQYRVSYPSLFDQASELAQRLGRDAPPFPPSTLVVDAQGRVAARIIGALNAGRGPVDTQVAQLRDVVEAVA